MCWKSARRSVCWHVCLGVCVCVSLDGHVAYVSLTLWVTEKARLPPSLPPTRSVTRYLHPFSTNMQLHTRGGRRKGKERKVGVGGQGVWGGGGVAGGKAKVVVVVQAGL